MIITDKAQIKVAELKESNNLRLSRSDELECYELIESDLKLPADATFTRSSVAYLSDGTQVPANTPRFEQGRFGKAIMVEEGTTNLAINPLLLDNNADNQPDSWTITDPPGGSHSLDYNKTWGGKPTWKLVQPVHSSFYGLYGALISFDRTKDCVIRVLIACEGAATSGIRRPLWIHATDNTGAKLADLGFADDPGGTHDFQWLEFKIPANSTPVGSTKIYFVRPSWTAGGIFWIAAIQVEQKPYATSFINGTRAAETLTIPTEGVLNPQEGTVELWFIPQSPYDYNQGIQHRRIFFAGTLDNSNFIQISQLSTNDFIRFMVGDGAGNNTIIFFTFSELGGMNFYGKPHFIAAAWSKSENRIYLRVDDQTKTSTYPSQGPSLTDTIYIGNRENTEQANGLIDDLRISSIARSDEEILAAYQSGQPLPVDEWTTYKLDFDDKVRITTQGQIICNELIEI